MSANPWKDVKDSATALARRFATAPALDPLTRDKCRRRTLALVKAGRLVRQPCEVCGGEPVHAHHESYRRPADVRWLCPRCHRSVHRGGGLLPLRFPAADCTDDELARWVAGGLFRGIVMAIEEAEKRKTAPTPTPAPPTLFVTVEEAATISGLSSRFLRNAIKAGRLPCKFAERRNWRTWRIRRKDLETL